MVKQPTAKKTATKKTAAKKASSTSGMSQAHKEALAKGREQGRKVRIYLQALESRQQPGRRQDPAALERKIRAQQDKIEAEANPARRVEHIQKRLDLEEALAAQTDQPDLDQLERDFIDAIPDYAQRKGLTYTAGCPRRRTQAGRHQTDPEHS